MCDLWLELCRQMRIVVDGQAIRVHFGNSLQGLLETLHGLVWQPVHELHIDRFKAQLPDRLRNLPRHLQTLNTV